VARVYDIELNMKNMKYIFSIILVVLLVASCRTQKTTVSAAGKPTPAPTATDTLTTPGAISRSTLLNKVRQEMPDSVSPRTLIIYYDKAVGPTPILKQAKKMHCEVLYQYNIITAVALSTPDSVDIQDAIKTFQKVKGVLSVERDRIMHLD
jgi:PBP1b-binding outer membrane lipoprotein LpoB